MTGVFIVFVFCFLSLSPSLMTNRFLDLLPAVLCGGDDIVRSLFLLCTTYVYVPTTSTYRSSHTCSVFLLWSCCGDHMMPSYVRQLSRSGSYTNA